MMFNNDRIDRSDRFSPNMVLEEKHLDHMRERDRYDTDHNERLGTLTARKKKKKKLDLGSLLTYLHAELEYQP